MLKATNEFVVFMDANVKALATPQEKLKALLEAPNKREKVTRPLSLFPHSSLVINDARWRTMMPPTAATLRPGHASRWSAQGRT